MRSLDWSPCFGHDCKVQISHDELARLVNAFLPAPKLAMSKIEWRQKGHADYSEAAVPLFCPSLENVNSRLILTAHKSRLPRKFGFALLLGSERVLALDVNPASYHINFLTAESVNVTHWQRWPMMEAEADDRQQPHRAWLTEFLARAQIVYDGSYEPPPFVEPQLQLL